MRAAEAGKQSVCLVELKARFDERHNIEQGRALEQAGVHVAYGFPDLKVHAKTTLVVRREGDRLRRYVHIGTGNYHSVTARLYEDVGHLHGRRGHRRRRRRPLQLPHRLRPAAEASASCSSRPPRSGTRLVALIRQVAAAAAEGKRAEIKLKVNALTDPGIIDELSGRRGRRREDRHRRAQHLHAPPGRRADHRAQRARTLPRAQPASSSSTPATSSHYLIGSADLMPRNLDHRSRSSCPVESQRAQAELNTIFDTLLQDNRQAWQLDATGRWTRLKPAEGEKPKVAQTALMRRAQLRERRQAEYRNRGR